MALRRVVDDEGNTHWVDIGDLGAKIGGSGGNTIKDVRRFIRSCGYKPTAANVEMIQREVSRTQSQNEQVERIAQETGQGGAYDAKGKITRERAKAHVDAEQEARAEREAQ